VHTPEAAEAEVPVEEVLLRHQTWAQMEVSEFLEF
jgi:hypothetical protein